MTSHITELIDVLERWFGKHWASRWEETLDEMPDAHVDVLTIDLLTWIFDLPGTAEVPRQPGELFPAVVARDGQEWRWLTAALFADRVVVDVASLTPTTMRPYREQCRTYLRSFTQLIGPALSGHLIASNIFWSVNARQCFQQLMLVPRFDRAVQDIHRQWQFTGDDLEEALFLYDAGDFIGVERACLVPSTDGCNALAELLTTRIRRIYGASVQRDAARRKASNELSFDFRPSLWNQLSVGSLPKLVSLDASLFADLVNEPRFEHFRHELRETVNHISEAPTTAELSERMAEAKKQISSQARAAQHHAEQLGAGRWKRVVWQTGGGGLLTALGFVTTGPIEAVAAAFAGSAVSALISAMTIDPHEPLSGTELTLLRLTEKRA